MFLVIGDGTIPDYTESVTLWVQAGTIRVMRLISRIEIDQDGTKKIIAQP